MHFIGIHWYNGLTNNETRDKNMSYLTHLDKIAAIVKEKGGKAAAIRVIIRSLIEEGDDAFCENDWQQDDATIVKNYSHLLEA